MPQLFEGVKVTLGRQTYIVPALTIRQVRQHRATLNAMSALATREPTEDEIGGMIDVAHAALSRNYPDMDKAQLEDVVDLNNLKHLMAAVVGQSGLERTTGEMPGSP